MTNIVTRKGLAFGALVALASTAIAGAPAHAAGEINVVPSSGTSYNIGVTDTFNLSTSMAPGFTPSSYAQLKYQVVTDGTATIKAIANTGAALSSANVATATTFSGNSNNTYVISASRPASGTGAGSAFTANDPGAPVSAVTSNFLGLQVAGATGTTATTSVVVTAFVDSDNDGALSAGEWNTAKTVTFKKDADIVPTVTLTKPSTGDTSVSATVAWGDLNIEQMAAESVKFTVGTQVASATAGTLASGTWTKGSLTALAAGEAVTAQAYDGTTALGTAATSTATARSISSITANVTKGADATGTSATTGAASTAAVVRTNGAWTATVKALDLTTPTAVAAANVAGTATISTNATLSGTAGSVVSVTVNGTTYTSTTGGVVVSGVAVTTDASGLASVNVSTAGFTAGQTVTVSFSAQNYTSAVVATATAPAYTITEASTASGYVTTPGATSALAYSVKDQFGQAISGATYRVKAVVTGGSGSRTYYSAPVAAGAASINVVDAQTTTTTAASVVASLETQDSSTLNWSAASATGVTTAILYSTTANGFSTAPAIDATNGINNGAWTTAGDQKQTITQSAIADLTANAAAGSTYAKLTFVAQNQYEDVTVSSTGAYLALGATAPSADTLSFQAASGTIVIYVAANTVGTHTVTFTSGAVTKTVDVKFASAAAGTVEGTATNFAVAATAAAQSGRAIDATVTVTDKWGNPVAGFAATATVSGVALVNGSAAANVTTDANGKATVKLSAGVNDLGDAVVTFSDNDSHTSTDVTAVAKTVTFGMTDGYIDVLNGKRASVTWSFAKGKRVAFYLDGVRKYNLVQPGDAELNLQFNLKKGSHNIKLVIGGVIVDDLNVKITK
jgi:hypothetical protein